MTYSKFVIFRSSSNSQYYFRLRSKANGEIILSSEGYTSKQNCSNAIASVKTHAPYDRYYDRREGLFNYTFNLKSANGEIIGRSENYTSAAARENGIEAVKRDAPEAPVEDLS